MAARPGMSADRDYPPSYVVAPGPLKSNGSPVKLIAILLLALTGLGFLAVRRGARTARLSPGSYVLARLLLGAARLRRRNRPHRHSPREKCEYAICDHLARECRCLGSREMTRIESSRVNSSLGATAIGLIVQLHRRARCST